MKVSMLGIKEAALEAYNELEIMDCFKRFKGCGKEFDLLSQGCINFLRGQKILRFFDKDVKAHVLFKLFPMERTIIQEKYGEPALAVEIFSPIEIFFCLDEIDNETGKCECFYEKLHEMKNNLARDICAMMD